MPEINIINLTVAPKGATHYKLSPLSFFKYSTKKDKMYYFTGGIWIELEHWPPASKVKKIEEWTIYNNTLPLCELTDEQAGQLFNAWRKGATLQIFFGHDGTWMDYKGALCRDDVFRIEQKSERELFVDAMMAGCSFDNSHAKIVRSVVEQIYDSGKVKLVKDGE